MVSFASAKTRNPRKPRLVRGSALGLEQLDRLLDVPVAQFDRTVKRLVREFRTRHITLRIPDGVDSIDFVPVDDSVSWVRLYNAQVQRLPKMERAEEFAMARRYVFVRARLSDALRRVGVSDEEIVGIIKRGQRELPELPDATGEGLAHLRQQVMIQEARDLLALRVHDPVDAEVELGLIELEELGQEALQFFQVVRHSSPRYATLQRMVKRWATEDRCVIRRSRAAMRASRFSMISSSTSKMRCRWRRFFFSSSRTCS